MHIILRYSMNATSAPRSSLRSFLTNAKANLQSAIINQQRVTLVIGNESADLDSITSAIILAYFRSNSSPTPLTNPSVNKHTPPSQYPPLYIPVINIPRADIKIRPELLALLPHANLDPSHLITLDDLTAEAPAGLNPDGREELQPQLTRLLLVDHNKLAGPLAEKGFADRVVGCIDHHVDEKSVPVDTGNEPRIIEKCGSCTTLVTQYCREAWDSLSGIASTAGMAASGQSDGQVGVDDDAVRRTWDAQIAKLAIASILIDTTNLEDRYKTTDNDKQAVRYLESKITLAPGGIGAHWARGAFYDEIDAAKQDLSSLTPREILRKDYKQYTVNGKKLGISAVVQTLSWQTKKAQGSEKFLNDIKKFSAQRELDIFAIMTNFTSDKGEFQRELLMCSFEDSSPSFVDKFEKEEENKLGLTSWSEHKGFHIDEPSLHLKVWWQDPQFSRKQVAPAIWEVIRKQ